jgi:hypothetical protein
VHRIHSGSSVGGFPAKLAYRNLPPGGSGSSEASERNVPPLKIWAAHLAPLKFKMQNSLIQKKGS